MLVAVDPRPAAISQLQRLGERLEIPVYSEADGEPPDICERAVQEARKQGCDVVIFDTMNTSTDNLSAVKELVHRIQPNHTFAVVDARYGANTVDSAREFSEQLNLSGFIATKLDDDASGAAVLSLKEATGKAIMFVGLGEELNNFERFRPDGVANRLLDFGDVVHVFPNDLFPINDATEAEYQAMRMLQGFTFDDFATMVENTGGLVLWPNTPPKSKPRYVSTSLNDRLAYLRRLLNEPPSLDAWSNLGQFLYDWPPHLDQAIALDYTRHGIERWRREAPAHPWKWWMTSQRMPFPEFNVCASRLVKSMLQSMTPKERKNPDVLKESESRQQRIARGSGCTHEDVQVLIQKFDQARKPLSAFQMLGV